MLSRPAALDAAAGVCGGAGVANGAGVCGPWELVQLKRLIIGGACSGVWALELERLKRNWRNVGAASSEIGDGVETGWGYWSSEEMAEVWVRWVAEDWRRGPEVLDTGLRGGDSMRKLRGSSVRVRVRLRRDGGRARVG